MSTSKMTEPENTGKTALEKNKVVHVELSLLERLQHVTDVSSSLGLAKTVNFLNENTGDS